MAAACRALARDARTAPSRPVLPAAGPADAPRPALPFPEILPRTEKPAGGGAYGKGLPKAPSRRPASLGL